MDCRHKGTFLRVEVGTTHYDGTTGVNWAGPAACDTVTLTVNENRVGANPFHGQHMSEDLYQAMETVHAPPGCV